MPDMLARLYDLPDSHAYDRKAHEAGVRIRRVEPWQRTAYRTFIETAFTPRWADEAMMAYAHQPPTAFVALQEQETVGFAAFECTRRGYFGPTGVREDLRGSGIGAALLLSCLRAMYELGYAYAIIGGVHDAQSFYEKACGAIVIPGSDQGIYGQ